MTTGKSNKADPATDTKPEDAATTGDAATSSETGSEATSDAGTDVGLPTTDAASDAIPPPDDSYPIPTGPAPTTEEMIAKVSTGRRVTPADLEREIVSELFFTAAHGAQAQGIDSLFPSSHPIHRLTFCVLTLRNGFTVHGSSSCVSPENFNAEIGNKIARENAVQQLWPLLGFRLADRIHHNLP